MNHILLVTEDESLKKLLIDRLATMGFMADVVAPGQKPSEVARGRHLDLVLIDASLNSHTVRLMCRGFKQKEGTQKTPVVVLLPEDGKSGFDSWELIEDFIVTPVRTHELELRIRQIRRRKGIHPSGEGICIRDLDIDFAGYEVRLHGDPVPLTFKEYELLKFLVTHPNRVFSRNTLLQQVWGYDVYVGTRTVDIHIRRLRHKLGEVGSGIQTVRNVGYKFTLGP